MKYEGFGFSDFTVPQYIFFLKIINITSKYLLVVF